MPITLAIADDRDGTGATATLAGGGVAAANVVSVYAFGNGGAMTLVDTFSRVGNGTVPIDVDPGAMYVGVLTSDDVFSGVPVFFPATDASDAILGDLLASIQTDAIAAALPEISANVLLRKFPWQTDGITLPALLVSPIREQLPNLGTNASDDTLYGVQLSAFWAGDKSDNSLAEDSVVLDVRDKLLKRFREKRIPNITQGDSYRTTVEAGDVFDADLFKKTGKYATVLLLRCYVREVRN